jgi:rSAM/selenodomain-associated transferase 1
VFARAPELGRVKTRLAADLGETAALSIYRQLGWHAAEQARRAGRYTRVVAFTPATAEERVREWLGADLEYEAQCEGDLGARMAQAIGARLAAGAERVVVIGTDCPAVDARVIGEAFSALRFADVVYGPVSDGGYCLVGMSRLHRELFDGIPWSSGDTLARSLEAARARRLSVLLLPEVSDVDTGADWERWQRTSDRRLAAR